MRRVLAARLGLAPPEAGLLLDALRAAVGPRAFEVRAVAFAISASRPARVLPRDLRRRALIAFLRPLLETPAALNLYAAGRTWTREEPCAGLVQDT